MKTIVFLLFSCLAVLVVADERGQSIMFQDQPDRYDHLTTEPKDAGKDLGDKCMQMSRQIEQLKGKPQRRHALIKQYQVECQEPGATTTPVFEPSDTPQ